MLPNRRDPHAHAVHAPGPRLLRTTPLRFVQTGGKRRRSLLASLGAVSLIDVLVVIILFLIAQPLNASGECCLHKDLNVPLASNGEELIEAPLVSVAPGVILVDGVRAGSMHEVVASGRVQRIDELRDLLRAKRELWRQVLPDKHFPGVAILEIDSDVPAVVVKSVFKSVVDAGYPNVSFMVHKLADLPE